MSKYIMFNMDTQEPRVIEDSPLADSLFSSATTPPALEEVMKELQERTAQRRAAVRRPTR